jgi:Myb/SANT-like DNA-binding domain
MSDKPTRARRAPNRNPTSLAIAISSPDPPIIESSLDPLWQIDPQLRTLDVAITLGDTIEVNYSPFSDAIPSCPPSPSTSILSPAPGSPQSDYFEPLGRTVISNDLHRPVSATQALHPRKGFTWEYAMEQSLFQELLNQANNGKRADSGFKREAWIAACEAVTALTTQDVTVERCKGKAEVMKALWKEFIWLKEQSGFGYDEGKGLITAGDQAWSDIIKVS